MQNNKRKWNEVVASRHRGCNPISFDPHRKWNCGKWREKVTSFCTVTAAAAAAATCCWLWYIQDDNAPLHAFNGFVSHDILCYFIFFTIWFWILCVCAAGCHPYSYSILSLCATLCLLMDIAHLQHFMCIGQLMWRLRSLLLFIFSIERERAKMWERVRFVT